MLIKIIELNWFELIAFTSVLLGTPGPATISLLYSGINYGFKKSLPYFLGIIIGFFCNLLIAAFGISAILEYQLIYNILKYTLLLYILYLAYKIATSTPFVENTESKPLLFSQGLLLNLLNPKAYIAVVSILSQFSVVNEYWYSVFYIIIINLSFVLILELARLQWIRLEQENYLGEIYCYTTQKFSENKNRKLVFSDFI